MKCSDGTREKLVNIMTLRPQQRSCEIRTIEEQVFGTLEESHNAPPVCIARQKNAVCLEKISWFVDRESAATIAANLQMFRAIDLPTKFQWTSRRLSLGWSRAETTVSSNQKSSRALCPGATSERAIWPASVPAILGTWPSTRFRRRAPSYFFSSVVRHERTLILWCSLEFRRSAEGSESFSRLATISA